MMNLPPPLFTIGDIVQVEDINEGNIIIIHGELGDQFLKYDL